MRTLTINNVVPDLGPDGALRGIAFTARLSDDESGLFDEMDWRTPCAMPARAQPYTAAELDAKCRGIVEQAGALDELEKRIVSRMDRSGPPPQPPAKLTESQQRGLWIDQIDDTIGAINTKYTRFSMAYIEREAEARAYIASGYTITPTELITRFADNVGMAYPDAAKRVVQQADALRPATLELDNLRMDKYLVARAPNIIAAEAEFKRILREANAIVAGLPK